MHERLVCFIVGLFESSPYAIFAHYELDTTDRRDGTIATVDARVKLLKVDLACVMSPN